MDLRADMCAGGYPWMLEWEAWQHGFQQKKLMVPGYQRDAPKAKLRNVLRCIEMARDTPEVWDRVVAQYRRPYVDPGLADNDDPEVAILYETGALVLRFTEWCRMKSEPDARPQGYGGVYDVLMAMARSPDQAIPEEDITKMLLDGLAHTNIDFGSGQ